MCMYLCRVAKDPANETQPSVELQNLLFLSKAVATYVLIHELCHIEQLNHSKEFWNLLENHVKNSRSMSAKAKQAGKTTSNLVGVICEFPF